MRGIGIELTNDFAIKVQPQRNDAGMIVDGVVLAKTLPQNQAIILWANRGELKQEPALGVAIEDELLNETRWSDMQRKIRIHMELDKQQVNGIKLSEGNIDIDAEY